MVDGDQELAKIGSDKLASTQGKDLFRAIPETERSLRNVHIGQLPLTPDGWSNGFKDTDAIRIPDLGFTFTVEQASFGYTGISAEPLEGFEIESLSINKDTQELEWKRPADQSLEKITISSDWGNLGKIDIMSPLWKQTNMGNEGVRSGIVRVKNKNTSEVKFYGLGAKFRGKPDNWNVERGIIEFEPTGELPAAPEALQSPAPEK